ncbi:MAG: XRE family transcriptional regulator [Cocleimonas sp.]
MKDTGETQTEVAKRLGITQSRISDLMRGKIQKFTIDNLVNMMGKSGYGVEINTKVA